MSGFGINFSRLEGLDQMKCQVITFVHSILFLSISLVIENSRSAVSGEQPKLETNSFSSVLSGFVM